MEAKRADSDPATYLKVFLRARRQRLRPEDLGLPSRHQRASGLRREDVAELLEVSPLWYALFESGKSGRRFSDRFLNRVQQVLCLDQDDRREFLELVVTSGHASPEVEARWHISRRQSMLNDVVETLQKINGAATFELALELARSSLRTIHAEFGAMKAKERATALL